MLIIEAAMVNPIGKSARLTSKVPNDLLNNEWVQIRNPNIEDISLRGLELMHWDYYDKSKGSTRNVKITRLSGILPGGCSLRIHSGTGTPSLDQKTQVYHTYVNQSASRFLYQISLPDCITLATFGGSVDHAKYSPPVPEGKRLKRGLNLESHKLNA